jgi:hypothetical protein
MAAAQKFGRKSKDGRPPASPTMMGKSDGGNQCGERRFVGRCGQYTLGVKWGCLRALWSGRLEGV